MQEHGSSRAIIRDRFVEIRPSGIWNRERFLLTRTEIQQAFERIREHAGPGPAAMLLRIGADYVAPTADGVEVLQDSLRMTIERFGRLSIAVIMERADNTTFYRHMLQRIHAEAGAEDAYFDDEDAAIAWLHTRLDDPPPKPPT